MCITAPPPRSVGRSAGRFALLFLVVPLALAGACKSGPEPAPSPGTGAGASAKGADETAAKVATVLAGTHRSEKNRARDIYRHPAETLAFFGLRDNMTVMELWPGGGWYTEILGPVLKERGKLIVTSFDPNGPEGNNTNSAKKLRDSLAANAATYGDVKTAIVAPPDKLELGPPASVDLVLTFRNLHNWIGAGIAEKLMAASFAVLKPGGVLGIVEHRANPGQDIKSGYVEEAVAIRYAESAGFKLAEKSEINANPKDTKDHPEGVWTLPPSLRLKDKDKDKYLAIGESDRMTLKFVKP
jgi:predicted methyltransferase